MTSRAFTESKQEKYGFAFISTIMLCAILNPLNSSTISVALPVLLGALHTTSSGITWIISGYYLGSAISQPVMGKLGDAWGRARFVYIGFTLDDSHRHHGPVLQFPLVICPLASGSGDWDVDDLSRPAHAPYSSSLVW